ncbi:MAG: lysozyme [Variibacter sp.]
MSKVKRAGAAVGISVGAAALAAAAIQHWEGEKLVASHNSFDPAGVVDVCNGITNRRWPWLKPGMRFTPEQCKQALIEIIPDYAAPLVNCINGFGGMPPHRQAALISASWNLGPATVCKSTAVKLLNAGDVLGGCKALGNFTKSNGVWLRGLWNRRNDTYWGEIAWCLRED